MTQPFDYLRIIEGLYHAVIKQYKKFKLSLFAVDYQYIKLIVIHVFASLHVLHDEL